jgi:glycine cleavage system aminomethyltransferase T
LGFAVDLDGTDFIGGGALKKLLDEGTQTKLCTITIGGEEWLPMYGAEAVLADGRVISRLRSSGYGHTVRKNIGLAYLPLELATVGAPLEIEIFGDMVPAQVAPPVLYDPKGEALRK